MRIYALFLCAFIFISGCAPLKSESGASPSSCDKIFVEFSPFLTVTQIENISNQVGLEVLSRRPGGSEYMMRILDPTIPAWQMVSEMKTNLGAYVVNARASC